MASFTLRFDVAAFLAAGVTELRLLPITTASSGSSPPARYAGVEDAEGYVPYEADDESKVGLCGEEPPRYAGVPADDEKIFEEDSGGQVVATSPTDANLNAAIEEIGEWVDERSAKIEAEPATPKRSRGRPRKTAEEIIENVEAKLAETPPAYGRNLFGTPEFKAEQVEQTARMRGIVDAAIIPEPVASAPEPIQIDIEDAIAASQEQDPFFSSVNRKTLQQLMVKHGGVIGFPKFTGWLQSTPYPKFSEVKDEDIPALAQLFYTQFPDAARSM